MRTVTTVANTHQTLAKQVESGYLVLALPSAEPDCTEALLIVQGRVAAQRRVKYGEPVAFVAEWLMAAYRRAIESPSPPTPLPQGERRADTDGAAGEGATRRRTRDTPLHRDGEGQGVRFPVIPQDDVDELHIIERWLHHHAQEPGQFPLPEDRDAAAGWWALAESLVTYDAAAEDWTKADLDAALVEDEEGAPEE
jgi:hypothetical protein